MRGCPASGCRARPCRPGGASQAVQAPGEARLPAATRLSPGSPQLVRVGVVAEFAEGLGLDLADAFAGDAEEAAYLLQGAGAAVGQAVAELDDLAFAFAESGEHRLQVLAQQQEGGRLDGAGGVAVLDEVTEGDVVLLADRGVQRHRLLRQAQHLADPLGRQVQVGGDLLRGRFAAAFLEHPALDADDPVDQLHDVDGDADGAGLVGQGAGHGLADPPGGVGGELVAAGVVELLDGPDQAQVPLLDQVQHGQPAPDVPLGHRHHEPQVGLDQAALGEAAQDDEPVEVEGETVVQAGAAPQLLLGEQPGLHPPGEVDLLGRGQQRNPADLAQVLPEQVGGGAAGLGTGGRRRFRVLGYVHGGAGVGQGRSGTGLRGHREEHTALRVRLRAAGSGVGLGERLGLHGGDLQDGRGRRGPAAVRRGRSRLARRCPPRTRALRYRPQCGVRHIAATRGVR